MNAPGLITTGIEPSAASCSQRIISPSSFVSRTSTAKPSSAPRVRQDSTSPLYDVAP